MGGFLGILPGLFELLDKYFPLNFQKLMLSGENFCEEAEKTIFSAGMPPLNFKIWGLSGDFLLFTFKTKTIHTHTISYYEIKTHSDTV